jgi:hypothetical protein
MKRSHGVLFACYLLAPVAMIVGAIGVSSGLYTVPAVATCSAYYALLVDTLFKCSKVGGWAGRFYLMAIAMVCAHLIPFSLLAFGVESQRWELFETLGLTIYGVYACCSLAGAALAWRLHERIEAYLQLLWPLIFWLPFLSPSMFLVPVLTFGAQGFQAMLLGQRLDPIEAAFEAPAIGWERPEP